MSIRLILIALLVACGGGSDPTPGSDAPPQSACDSIAGTWDIDGTCGDDLCTITQNGCAITGVTCTSGSRSTSGTLDDNGFSYTGTSGAGAPATCSGTVNGNSLAGTCSSAGTTCTISGARR